MRSMYCVVSVVVGVLAVLAIAGRGSAQRPAQGTMQRDQLMNLAAAEVKWERIVPDLGKDSPEIAILHVDPETKATQLFIRTARYFHVPKHWHSANETHTVLAGTFVVEANGQRAALRPGSFNYLPARMHHEAWIEPSKNGYFVVFITVDGGWDVNWVERAPNPSDIDPAGVRALLREVRRGRK